MNWELIKDASIMFWTVFFIGFLLGLIVGLWL